MTDIRKIAQYQINWQDEVNSAALYRALFEIEQLLPLKEVYRRLAEAEERHSCFWEAKLRATKHTVPAFKLHWRTRTLIFWPAASGHSLSFPMLPRWSRSTATTMSMQPEARPVACPSKNSRTPACSRCHQRFQSRVGR